MFHVKHAIKRTTQSQTASRKETTTPPTFHVKHPNRHETSNAWSAVKRTQSNFHIHPNMEAYWVAGNSIHANGEQIERRYHSACFSKPPKNGHMHQCLEKLNHIFPATEASMFHVKHPPPTRKTKTQNTTPLQQKQPTFHIKQLGYCRNVVFHVKHRETFKHQETWLQSQKISFTSIAHVPRETTTSP